MSFRKVILREVQQQGTSGYALAKAAGLNVRQVQLYLAGRQDMTGERLSRIATVLGLELRCAPGRERKR